MTFVLTADLAGYLAAATDTEGIDGQRIDIGWDRPVSMQEVAEISGRILGNRIRVRTIPSRLIQAVGTVLGPINPMVKGMGAMAGWFQSGQCVADTTRQREVFGAAPTAENAIARLVTSLGHTVKH